MLRFEHTQVIGTIGFNVYKKETIIVDRNLEWTSVHGKKTKLVDMDDAYLANLFDYLLDRCRFYTNLKQVLKDSEEFGDDMIPFDVKVLLVIKELQKERGLKNEFMDRAQIPYKNPRGKWEIWDFDKRRPVELEEE